ncbi:MULTISPECIES: cyclophilin-like fold protein [Rhizobium/Agrobacterium group]|uniref:cyclophilin-like fold protein n=1 Tax=Rhizobium/Agrobacterium group TaxID=227290 RepID=UPI0023018F39|nr:MULTISPECIES: cyclophilin-like fold protein [Rhizobium/Agrobacterium group]MDA5635036.1 cyclophilin-like fold protein [Agrobacterium sp. ST15.16.024]MDF1890184.1 cyclophilin-like fold protein [Rhizobium rhizogenes]
MSIRPAQSARRALLVMLGAFFLPGRAFSNDVTNRQERTDVRIKLTFAENTMIATLYENPSARDFVSMLPLDLKITDFSSNEKIAYLPRKLTIEGHGPFDNEQPYDLCYYMPWGNLAMFYADYRHPGLIRLGRFEQGYEALHLPGEFPLRIERI